MAPLYPFTNSKYYRTADQQETIVDRSILIRWLDDRLSAMPICTNHRAVRLQSVDERTSQRLKVWLRQDPDYRKCLWFRGKHSTALCQALVSAHQEKKIAVFYGHCEKFDKNRKLISPPKILQQMVLSLLRQIVNYRVDSDLPSSTLKHLNLYNEYERRDSVEASSTVVIRLACDLLGASTVPVTFVIDCWEAIEIGALADGDENDTALSSLLHLLGVQNKDEQPRIGSRCLIGSNGPTVLSNRRTSRTPTVSVHDMSEDIERMDRSLKGVFKHI
jgi:hypothetical protein